MINVHGLRRNVKNVVKNYSEAQIKVREATSNDPWGPSGTLMSEIADLTYNVVAFSEIMQVIWKRLNDHGKNWKHVYKALVLLEYLIKTGSEKVTQQCKENIFAIQTLKDFQYTEENKDQGINVREKAKQLVSLLKDDDRLKSERARALKARERFAQATSHVGNEAVGRFGSTDFDDSHNSLDEAISPRGYSSSELENARPQTAGEEELQLQLALAMSKEEAEQEERVRRNDDLRLKMALTESEEAFKRCHVQEEEKEKKSPAIDDLLGICVNQQVNNQNPVSASAVDPWGLPLGISQVPSANDTSFNWNMTTSLSDKNNTLGMGPWTSTSVYADPWNSKPVDKDEELSRSKTSEYDAIRGPIRNSPDISRTDSSSPFDMLSMKKSLSADSSLQSSSQDKKITPEVFLGANSNLVNLDVLINSGASSVGTAANTFTPASYNPFQAMKPAPPTINELRAQNEFPIFPAASNSPVFGNASSPLATNENSTSNQSMPSNNNPFI